MCAFVYAGGESGEKTLPFCGGLHRGHFVCFITLRGGEISISNPFGVSRSVWEICVQQHPFAGDKRELRREKGGGEKPFLHFATDGRRRRRSRSQKRRISSFPRCAGSIIAVFSPSIPPFHAMFFRRGEMAGPSRIALCYRSWPATASFGGKIETTPDKKRLGLPN